MFSAFATKDVDLAHFQLDSSSLRPEYVIDGQPPSIGRIIRYLQRLLYENRYRAAFRYWYSLRFFVPMWRYHQIQRDVVAEQLPFIIVKGTRIELSKLLDDFKFGCADVVFCASRYFPRSEYETRKAEAVKLYSAKELAFEMTQEQADAIAKMSKNLLIRARAGSGKTSVMATKVATLLVDQTIEPDSVLVLAFNRMAAQEIKGRIERQLGLAQFATARTFHSLGYGIIEQGKRLLHDDNNMAQTNTIRDLLFSADDPAIERLLLQFFRAEIEPLPEGTDGMTEEQYYEYRRSLRYISLAGDRVKSNGEKWIADFLFEHDIRYDYERPEYANNGFMFPDFTIFFNGSHYVLEHWGIDENDAQKQVPDHWDISWTEYRRQMHQKRTYWQGKGQCLIETSILDMVGGRDSFTQILAAQLQNAGITFEPLSQEELWSRVKRIHEDRMSSLVRQAIQRAKRRQWSPTRFNDAALGMSGLDERSKAFYTIVSKVYADYQAKLIEDDYFDFDDMINDACARIEESGPNCRIRITKTQSIPVEQLRWILIDEYQDFSPAFHELIQTMGKVNPQLRICAVGDDWQAINGFAGSELRYFQEFSEYFPGNGVETTDVAELTLNHRSREQVVKTGNRFMAGKGSPAKVAPGKTGGEVTICDLSTVKLPNKADATTPNYYFNGFDPGFFTARTLKACVDILKNGPMGQSAAILSRTGRIHGVQLKEFRERCHELLCGFALSSLECSTVHGFKGREADTVIIVDANHGSFPLVHPDSFLFRIFGVTIQSVLDEEERLFYVALSRARNKLWILANESSQSEYVTRL